MVALSKVDYEGYSINIFNNNIKYIYYVFNIIINNIITILLNTLTDETFNTCFITY